MNKIIMGLIVAVCVLGMALIMLNEKLGRKPDPAPTPVETPSEPLSQRLGSAQLPGDPVENDLMASLPAPKPSPAPSLTPSPAPVSPLPDAPAAPPSFSFGGEQEMAPVTLPPLPQTPPLNEPDRQESRAPATATPAPVAPPLPDLSTEERKDVPVPSLASSVVAQHEREAAAAPKVRQEAPRKEEPRKEEARKEKEKAAPAPAPVKKEEKAREEKPREEKAEKEERPKAEAPRQEKESAPQKEERRKPAPEKAAASADKSVERFVVYAREGGATVRIVGNAGISYKPMVLTGPDRVVVDLDGDWDIKAPGVPKNDLVTNVRIGKLNGKTRVVIDLKDAAKPRYTLSKDRRMLDIRVDK